MKCPYQTITIHKPEKVVGYEIYYAQDITKFGECYKDKCPFYYTKQEHKEIERCHKAESEGVKNEMSTMSVL